MKGVLKEEGKQEKKKLVVTRLNNDMGADLRFFFLRLDLENSKLSR